jgi:ABC-2 type transport system ATP-binding protein
MPREHVSAPPAPGEPILTLREVNKSYGEVRAVQDVSLQIPRGSIYGFLGPNGAGKTTTIRAIMGIILPDSGAMEFCGRPLTESGRDRIGYLPEERGLYRKMKVVEQLAYLAELKGLSRAESLRRSHAWLERLGLGDWKLRKIDELSKGMQQKVQFAATFIFEPELVVLDEPYSGLDPLNIEMFRDTILEQRSRGVTIIFSTHILGEAERICDAICLIDGGQKILDGTLEEVRRQFPLRCVEVAYEDGGEPPADLPGVRERERNGNAWRLVLATEGDPQGLLRQLQAAGPLSLFAAGRPSLSDIFLAAVRQRRALPAGAATAPALSTPEVAS